MENEKVAVLLLVILLLQLRQLKPTREQRLWVLVFALLCLHPRILGSETLTLTTYYPAPYGAYAAMLTTNQTLLARDGGAVGIGYKRTGSAKLAVSGNVGIGTTEPYTDAAHNSGGNIDANDVWLRSVNKWASAVTTGYLGLSTNAYKGNFGGQRGAASICSAQYGAGAHLCTVYELGANPPTSSSYGWYDSPVFVGADGLRYFDSPFGDRATNQTFNHYNDKCTNWTAYTNSGGNILVGPIAKNIAATGEDCSQQHPIHCCR